MADSRAIHENGKPSPAGPSLVAVTGCTGRVGGLVAGALARSGLRLRLVVRDLDRAPRLAGAAVARAEYADKEAVRMALEGVDVALMVSATEGPDRVHVHQRFIEAAVEAGVGHLVYTSVVGAAADSTHVYARDHFATERLIHESGLAATILRDSAYMDLVPWLADEHGVIRGPAGDGTVPGVAITDVAACAVAILKDPARHAGATYHLTGPEALTLTQITERMTAWGRPMRFENQTPEEAYASRAASQAPDWQIKAWISSYLAIAAGELSLVTNDVETLTGRPPTTLEDIFGTHGRKG